MANRPHVETGTETETETREKTELARPWRVIVHNDDVTPMDFVVRILTGVFALAATRAARVMLEAHHQGVAHVATLPLEEAEARVEKAHALARASGYPLTFTYEPE